MRSLFRSVMAGVVVTLWLGGVVGLLAQGPQPDPEAVTAAWVGVVGTLAGALSGGLIAAYMTYREQRRAPTLLLLKKRMEAYSELYGKLYSIAECLHQGLPPDEGVRRIEQFRVGLLGNMLYLSDTVREKVLPVHNHLMESLDAGQLDSSRLMPLVNEANRALIDAVRISET